MGEQDKPDKWFSDFRIQSAVDLDFVVNHNILPIGMMGKSPADFKRRVFAAGISYQLQLKSIDYTLRKYVPPNLYEDTRDDLGEATSIFLRDSAVALKDGLKRLHRQGTLTFGQFAAEISLYKIPETLDMARMTANRGLFLEVLPILRLCLEMASWSAVVFFEDDEKAIKRLKAQSCIQKMKSIYGTAGRLYGYFSKFSHWEFDIHTHFLNFDDGQARLVSASCKYRAMSLTLCLVILDIVLEVIRHIYGSECEALIEAIQGTSSRIEEMRTKELVSKIVQFSDDDDFFELGSFLDPA